MLNYSIFNNYKYSNKDIGSELLDFVSCPLRTSLGGRTINILNSREDLPSIIKRIANFIISFAFFPVALVGAVCLLLKSIRLKEKTIVCKFLEERNRFLTLSNENSSNLNESVSQTYMVRSSHLGSSTTSLSAFDRLCIEPYKFYQEIQKTIKDKKPFHYNLAFIFLQLCPCLKLTVDLRTKLENDSIERLKKTHPSREATINVVSVGPGGLYQELVYLAKLAKAGYKHIRLITIDPLPIKTHVLDAACKDLIPAKITIDNQYSSLDNYIQKATQDKTLQPDLLLLIDLTDEKYKVNSQFLSNYSFSQLNQNNLLKNGTVISHSLLEKTQIMDTSGKVIKVDFTPKVFSGIVTSRVNDLSSLKSLFLN